MTEGLAQQRAPQPQRPRLVFVLIMLTLAAMLFALGVWQVMRLNQKDALIARMEQRINAPVQALPPAAEWGAFDPQIWDYRQVSFAGSFVPGKNILVFTNLSDPQGKFGGPGYWVMTPFALENGGYVLVNRGFVPEGQKGVFVSKPPEHQGFLHLEGIARVSETANAFTPGPDQANNVEWVRDVARLQAMLGPNVSPLLPIYVDLDKGAPGALPQGGETSMTIPNRHLGYAITWFGLGTVALVLLGYWLMRKHEE